MSLAASNLPLWNPKNAKKIGAFHEVWYLKLNDPANQRALWLRFVLLISGNGFKKISETWGVFFQRGQNREVIKFAVKQAHDIGAFSFSDDSGIRIGDCELNEDRTRGSIQSKGRTLQWDLTFVRNQKAEFSLIPDLLRQSGFVKNSVTSEEDLRFSGTTQIDGEEIRWENCPGMQGHLSGPKSAHSWVWGHCNSFADEKGNAVPFVFEGLTAQTRLLGPIHSPKLSSFYFNYQGKPYYFNTVLSALQSRSENSLTDWKFQAERGDISFRGHARAEHKDFVGLTYEDTNGSFIYCANSKLSDLTVHVYRRGKIEATLNATGTAAFEVVSREKNPYVPLVI